MKPSSESERTILLATGGEHITNVAIQQGLRLNIIAGALGLSWFAMAMGMPLQMFAEALGAKGIIIGLLGTVVQMAMLVQIPASILVERLSARKPIWGATVFTQRVMWFILPIITVFLSHDPAIIAVSLLVMVFINAALGYTVTPAWYSWFADLVPEQIRGSFWGARQSWTMAAYLVAVAVSGYLLDILPLSREHGDYTAFNVVFTLAAVLGCLDIIVHMRIPEPRPHRATGPASHVWKQIVETMQNADFRRLTWSMGLYTFSVGLVSLGGIFLKKQFAVSYSHLAWITVAAALGTTLFGFIWGYILDRIGGRALNAFLIIMAPLVMVVWFFVQDTSLSFRELMAGLGAIGQVVNSGISMLPNWLQIPLSERRLPQPIWLLMLVNLFAGALYGGIGVCHVSLLGALVPKNRRTLAMAVHWSIVGLLAAGGPVLAGKVMDYFAAHPLTYVMPTGTRLAFHHMLVVSHLVIMWFIVLPVFLKIRKEKDEPAVGSVFSMLLTPNPFRVVTEVYMMGKSPRSSRRAKAIHRLGRRRASIAVSDLVQRLDDPSYAVREEAAMALGSIGTDEAVNALSSELDNTNSPLMACAAKALGMAKHPAGLPALLGHLGSGDAQTRAECARALGAICDKQAVGPLVNLVVNDSDPRVFTASAEALALIDDARGAESVMRRMTSLSDPVLKGSLAVAAGDLIGERDEFYQVLRHERQLRGKAVASMLEDLRDTIHNGFNKIKPSQTADVKKQITTLQRLFEAEDGSACAGIIADLAGRIADLKWDCGSSDPAVHNAAFGAAAWYAGTLKTLWTADSSEKRNWVEILLGIYLLTACARND